jgi:hypothetical protein
LKKLCFTAKTANQQKAFLNTTTKSILMQPDKKRINREKCASLRSAHPYILILTEESVFLIPFFIKLRNA